MTNSNSSRRSSWAEVPAVVALLILIVAGAGYFFYTSGYLLYYGDAQAHLNISRSLIDSRTPGYDQLGTVWLPVLHLICLPFVTRDQLWQSGLAGTVPVAVCFVIAGLCLYLCAREVFQSSGAALSVLLCFAVNPNIVYLACIPMTEMVFIAGLSVCLLSILQFRKSQQTGWLAVAIAASWWMSLTRYDGWFLIPFISLFLAFVAREKKVCILIATAGITALAPVYWFGHNWWETSNPLDFYDGPYSAMAIQGDRPYPGYHDWPQAIHYYFEAARLCCGDWLMALGIIGLLVAVVKGRWLAVVFLSMTPLFYVWSVHGSKTPIHIPTLWPNSYYNTRYGLAVVVLMAFAVGSLVSVLPLRLRVFGLLFPLLCAFPWMLHPTSDEWICWKESQRNSDSRRAWTASAAAFLKASYRSGDGVLTEFGDLSGIFCKAALPLKESLHEGNQEQWFANTMPNGVVHQMKWAVAQEGDQLANRLAEAKAYRVVRAINVSGAPRLLIYERN